MTSFYWKTRKKYLKILWKIIYADYILNRFNLDNKIIRIFFTKPWWLVAVTIIKDTCLLTLQTMTCSCAISMFNTFTNNKVYYSCSVNSVPNFWSRMLLVLHQLCTQTKSVLKHHVILSFSFPLAWESGVLQPTETFENSHQWLPSGKTGEWTHQGALWNPRVSG